MRTLLFFFALLFGGSQAVFGQTDMALLRQLAEENKKSIEALALYPEDARLAILESSKHPEVLIKMKNAQEKTSAAFRTLIEDFPRNTQTVFYDLTRYPGLVSTLVERRNDRQATRQALDVVPEDKRDEVRSIAEDEILTLVKIDNLMNTSQRAFEQMIAGYPAPARSAFQKLLEMPEVVDILNEDLRFTVLVGDLYKEDPAWVIHNMDSLSLAVARQHATELDNWKKTIENDPNARSEFQSAAQEYANEYGYTDEVYDVYNDDVYADYDEQRYRTEYNYYQYNYPYWFGYPWWAPQPCWRPYPYWWYWGFYPYHQTIVIMYFPSYHFMHWYFWHPQHHHRYNHLSTHFVNHYYGHRRSGTAITMGVGEWRNRNREVISDAWLSDKARLPQRLQEYGKFEEGRQKYNTKNPSKAMTPSQYADKNAKKYPGIKQAREQAQTEIQRERTEQDRQRSNWAPPKEPVKQKQETAPARVPATQQPAKPKPQPAQPTREPVEKAKPTEPAKRPERPVTQPKKPAVDEAKEYHRDKWQEPRQTQPKTERAPAQTKQSAPATRKETPQTKQTAPATRREAPKTQPEKSQPAPQKKRNDR